MIVLVLPYLLVVLTLLFFAHNGDRAAAQIERGEAAISRNANREQTVRSIRATVRLLDGLALVVVSIALIHAVFFSGYFL